MRDVLDRRDDGSYTHPTDPGEPSTGKARVSITDVEAELLAFLAHGKIVLEIGTGLGVSTRALASTALGVVTVDIDPWVRSEVWPHLPQNVEKRWDRSTLTGPFDLVFIDGDHSIPSLLADIVLAEQVCPRGVLVAHDATQLAQSLEGWHHIPTTHGVGLRWVGW